MKGQGIINHIQDWITNEQMDRIAAQSDWNGSYMGWITIWKEDDNRFTYQYGRETRRGKWKTITQLDKIPYEDLIKQLKRLRNEYYF